MIIRTSLLCLLAATALAAPPEPVSLDYTCTDPDGSKLVCEGTWYAPAGDDKLPAVIVVHDWMGPSDHYRKVARELASHGMVAFAIDCYGKGVRPTDRQSAAAAAGHVRGDAARFRARMKAALAALLTIPRVDPEQVVAQGYCFGGTAVLELARSGAKVRGVVSLHGGLKTLAPASKGAVGAKVLVLHGAADPHVPPAEVTAFMAEMRAAEVDWQLIHYAGAVHGFTKPGKAYQEAAAKRARAHTLLFYEQVLGRKLRR